MSGPFGSSPWGYNPGGDFYSYTIDQSLRFNDNDSAYLHRTVGTTGNRKTWTFSCWLKGASFAGSNVIWATSQLYDTLRYTSTGKFMLLLGNTSANLQTTAVFRDPSAWYNLVIAVDTTQSTSTDRVKFYVNGSQITSFSTASYPSLNYDTGYNHTSYTNAIGRRQSTSNLYWDSYLAEVNFVDGTALTADSFGETKDGIWIPKAYSGSYGTNGFYLTFQGTGTATTSQGTTAQTNIGDDQSGTGNNFAVSGLASSDVVPDSPTNNFATYNINVNTGQSLTYEEGNLNNSASGSFWSTSVWQQSSLGITGGANAGKYYFEYCTTTSGSGQATGVAVQSSSAIDTVSHNDGVIYYYTSVKTGNTVTVSGISNNPTYDVLRFAFDASNGKVWIGNSTGWFNSGDPAAGTGESGTIANYDGSVLVAVTNRTTITSDHIFNFGQDSTFAGFKASGSANGSDANGIGDFYYAVPSGFLALASSNIPEPEIIDGTEYFNTVLYTGNDGTQSITGVGFQPDLVWLKQRSAPTRSHRLNDSVRGANKQLYSNLTNTEGTATNELTSFDSDGFSLGSANGVNGIDTYVGWNWLAGTAFSNDASATGVGTIDSSGQVNTTAGFSIVSYTGTGSNGTIAHGLSSAPNLVIVKGRNDARQWAIGSDALTDWTKYLLFTTASEDTAADLWNSTAPSSSVFSVGTNINSNKSTVNYIAYCFHSVEGYSKVGSYIGNGSSDGPFIYTGFRPAWILIKKSSATGSWVLHDTVRDPFNPSEDRLYPDDTDAEIDAIAWDSVSNGFKIRNTSSGINTNNATNIYLAFAESPFKYANAR